MDANQNDLDVIAAYLLPVGYLASKNINQLLGGQVGHPSVFVNDWSDRHNGNLVVNQLSG